MIDDRREFLAAWAAECIGVQGVTLGEFLGGAANAGFEVTIDAQPDPIAFLRTNVDDRPDRLGYTLQREGAHRGGCRTARISGRTRARCPR